MCNYGNITLLKNKDFNMNIVIANEKGGVGKSTLSTNLAVEYSKTYNVLLIDTDTSGVSTKFIQRRADLEIASDNLSLASLGMDSNIDDLAQLMKADYEVIIVDVGGFSDDISITALIHSHLLLIPTSLSAHDLDAHESFIQTINKIKENRIKLNIAFIPNKIDPRTNRNTVLKGFKEINTQNFPILNIVKFYKAFDNAHGSGLSVCELNPDSKAAKCINVLKQDIEVLLYDKAAANG